MSDIAAKIWAERERRLEEIRREVEKQAAKAAKALKGNDVKTEEENVETSMSPVSRGEARPSPTRATAQTGYYGTPALKRPQWTVEVPIYFFVGGLAGAASVIAAVGELSSADARLIRHSRWLAAIGGLISPALLISDLGMPSRFLNMLRVFKIQSPMSVGSWTLVAFSNSAAAAAVLGEIERRRPSRAISVLTDASQIVATLTGMVLSTYTGVLIGATAIPAWNEHVATLPIHFAASGTSAAASILELSGNKSKALNRIAIGAAAIETVMGVSIELSSAPATQRSLRSGLALRLLASGNKGHARGLRRAAALASLAGSILTRWAWIRAGKASAEDPSVPLQLKAFAAQE
jgi:hypothetical protein